MSDLGRKAVGLGLLLAALIVLFVAVWPIPQWAYRDYQPPPDAPEGHVWTTL